MGLFAKVSVSRRLFSTVLPTPTRIYSFSMPPHPHPYMGAFHTMQLYRTLLGCLDSALDSQQHILFTRAAFPFAFDPRSCLLLIARSFIVCGATYACRARFAFLVLVYALYRLLRTRHMDTVAHAFSLRVPPLDYGRSHAFALFALWVQRTACAPIPFCWVRLPAATPPRYPRVSYSRFATY